jgi:hypothetical protein
MQWLGRIGITALVIGLGFLLNYWVPHLEKGGKAALAYTLSAVLLGLGVWGEKSERYRNLARVVLGGGWAATYGTTYALHHADAMRLVGPEVGFALLFVVAAGIVAHSLRYNSQVVTGFAYVLGFVTVVLGRINLGTVVASALLAASLVVVLWKRKWYWLEPVGIAATYGVHWLWLQQEFSRLLDREQFTDFGASAALLTAYWLLFTASHFLREDREPGQRRWLTTAFLLNAAGYLLVMGYQSLYPELSFWFLLGVGAAYLALAVLSRWLNRRLGFLLCSTLGAALVLVAIPYKFSGARLEYIWLIEAEVFLFLGWRLADAHLRKLGWAAAGVLFPYIVIKDLVPRLTERHLPDAPLGWLLLGLALAYFANSRYVPRLLRKEATPTDENAALFSAPAATVVLLAAAWVALPFPWVAVAWAVAAVVLREYGRWMDDAVLRSCGYGAAAAVVLRLLIFHTQYHPAAGEPNLHIWTTALAAALLYVCAWRLRRRDRPASDTPLAEQFFGQGLFAAYAWGTTLPVAVLIAVVQKSAPELTLAVLGLAVVAAIVSYPIATGYLMTAAWLGLPFVWVAPVWAALALLLRELGVRRQDASLRTCGHIAAVLTLARLLAINMQYAPAPLRTGMNLPVVTIALAAALLYVCAWRLRPREKPASDAPLAEQFFGQGLFATYAWGTTLPVAVLIAVMQKSAPELTLAVLGLAVVAAIVSYPIATGYLMTAAWLGLPFVWVAPVWAALALLLRELGVRRQDASLRTCGHIAAVLTLARLLAINMQYAPAPLRTGMNLPVVTIALAAALLYVCAWRLRPREKPASDAPLAEQFFGQGLFATYAWGTTLPVAVLIAVMQVMQKSAPELTWAVLGLAVVAAIVSYPIATGYLMTAAWLGLPFMWVAPVWAALALLLRELGVRRQDASLRTCGHIAAVLTLARLFVVNLPYAPAPLRTGMNLPVVTIALAAALLYVCAWRLRRQEKPASDTPLAEQFFGQGLFAAYAWGTTLPVAVLIAVVQKSAPELTWAVLGLAVVAAIVSYPIATGYLMTAAWLGLHFMWVAVVWTVLALLLAELGIRRQDLCLRVCGHLAALCAVARLLAINMQYAPPSAGLGANLRVWTVALAVALYYILARRTAPAKTEPEPEVLLAGEIVWRGGVSPAYTTAGTLLAGLLIWNNWHEVTPAAVGLAWGMLGLALVEAGRAVTDRAMNWQGHALLVLSFGRIFIADLNMVDTLLGGVSARLVTVTLLAAIYYYTAFSAEEKERMRTALFWFGSIAVAAVLRFELAPAWVAVAWAGLAVVLFIAGRMLRLKTLAHQAYVLTAAIAARCAFDDFLQAETRTMTVVSASLLLYVLLGVTLVEKRQRALAAEEAGKQPAAAGKALARWAAWLDENPQHLYFFVPTILLTVLLVLEVPRSYLTAAWGVEGVAVFAIALLLGERAFRLSSMGLLLLCVGRLVIVDVWTFDPLGRIISFMALGAALLVVSYLYTRYRESWRKYL